MLNSGRVNQRSRNAIMQSGGQAFPALLAINGIVNLLGTTQCGKFVEWIHRLSQRNIRIIDFL
jgi:hypothetical protein